MLHVPHALLFSDQPLYFLPLRVFGCTCFVHILTLGQDKLSAKAMKCIFLATPDFRRVIVVIPLRLVDTFSPRMSPSSRTPPSSPPPSFFPLLKSYPFLSSPRLYLMMSLLVPFRFIIAITVLLFLSFLLMPLLTHFLSLQLLLPRFCLLLITCPLLFGKVIVLLAILILFTIF